MHTPSLLAASALLLAALGCRDDTESPTEPAATTPVPIPEAAVTSNSWVTKADYPVNIWGPTSTAITNSATLRTTLYVIGGRTKRYPTGYGSITSAVRAYNVSANTWQSRASYPRPIQSTNGAMALSGKVYVSGGLSRWWDAADSVYQVSVLAALYVYNPSLNQWTRKRDMPFPTASGVSAVYQGNLYVVTSCYDVAYCGHTPDFGALFRYNPATDRWHFLTRTPHNPSSAAGGVIGGKFYVVSTTGLTDIYTFATGAWSAGPRRPFASCDPAYTTFQAKLYLTGCQDFYDDSGLYAMLVYDPKLNTWTKRAAPPPRTDIGTLSRVTLTTGQVRLELVGGSRPGNNVQYIP